MSDNHDQSSNLVSKGPCPSCGSKDNLATYDDGHTHCFGMGCDHHTGATVQGTPVSTSGVQRKPLDLISGEVRALPKRGLTLETCEKWRYLVGSYHARPVQIAQYFSGGRPVAQKLRFPDKDFKFIGETKGVELYGQHLWRDAGKSVVITEGEIDAMSVSQIQGNRWPVVSVPNGAQGAAKSIAKQLPWLNQFERVILMFDNDEAGQMAVEECVELFPPGKCRVASLPLKDANAMLMAGRGAEVVDAIFGAKVHRPGGIVTLSDIRADVMKKPEEGLPWWSPTMTKLTFGRRYGEVYCFGAGTGIGKTDWLAQQMAFDLTVLGQKIGVFSLEQQPTETAKRLAGKVANRRFHVPDDGWTTEELSATLDKLDEAGVFFYDHFGSTDWEVIRDRIRYLYHSEGVKLFYLDHLTALAAEEEDERKALETIMAQIGGLVKELKIVLHLVSHLATPEGKPHEEGGRVMIRHFKGSRAIGFWCHYMIGFERNQQSENEAERNVTTVRILKDRYTGQATGKTHYNSYDHATGQLAECEAPQVESSNPFKPTGSDDF